MRDITVAVLAVASALVANVASAQGESVHVLGGKLSSSGPPFNFAPGRANILITNLPAGWPARGQCRTLTHETAPKVGFGFGDGLTTGGKLVASGYTLDGGTAGRSFFAGRTYVKLCRNAAGKPAAFAIQLSYYKFTQSNVLHGYVLYAENDGAGHGMSSVSEGALANGSAQSGATASSYAVNTLEVRQ